MSIEILLPLNAVLQKKSIEQQVNWTTLLYETLFYLKASCMTEKEAFFLALKVKSYADKFYVGISDL
jgi:hypothetical protein